MAEQLAQFSEQMSDDFAHKIIECFTWLYQFNVGNLHQGSDEASAELMEIIDLTYYIIDKLRPSTKPILNSAIDELVRFGKLNHFLTKESRSKRLDQAAKKGSGVKDIVLIKLIADFIGSELSPTEKVNPLSRSRINEFIAFYYSRRAYFEKFMRDCDDPEPLLMMLCTKKILKGTPENSFYRSYCSVICWC
jgi:hypothetical protein